MEVLVGSWLTSRSCSIGTKRKNWMKRQVACPIRNANLHFRFCCALKEHDKLDKKCRRRWNVKMIIVFFPMSVNCKRLHQRRFNYTVHALCSPFQNGNKMLNILYGMHLFDCNLSAFVCTTIFFSSPNAKIYIFCTQHHGYTPMHPNLGYFNNILYVDSLSMLTFFIGLIQVSFFSSIF
jgi:hypothetical protein